MKDLLKSGISYAMEFHIGSNIWLDAAGVIVRVGGVEQFKLEVRADGQPLLTADIYNQDGEHVAKLNRNAWAFKDERYNITSTPSSLTLQDTRDGSVLFAAEQVGGNKIRVHPCRFFTPTGVACEVTSSQFQIGAMTLIGNVAKGSGAFVIIDDSKK